MASKGAFYGLTLALRRLPRSYFASMLRRRRTNHSICSLIAPPESRLRRTPLGMIVSSTLSSSARTEPSPLEKTKSGSSKTKAVKPGNTGCSSPPREAGDHHAPSAAAEADSTSTSFISRAKDSDRVVMDPLGEPRKPQRVEVEYGNFHEFTAINKTGGKLFEASRKLIPAQDAVVFPNMEASSLAGGADVDFPSRLKGRVTLVGLFHRQFGYNMLPTWTEPFEEAFGMPGTRSTGSITPSMIHISLLESWPLRLLKSVLVPAMALGVAKEKKASFYYRFGNTDEASRMLHDAVAAHPFYGCSGDTTVAWRRLRGVFTNSASYRCNHGSLSGDFILRKVLGIENRLTLYVVLVDQEGRVRWRASGKGTPDELESLIRCARQLADGRG